MRGVTDAKDPKGRKIYFLRQIPRAPLFPGPQAEPNTTWRKRSYASEPNAPRELHNPAAFDAMRVRIGACILRRGIWAK